MNVADVLLQAGREDATAILTQEAEHTYGDLRHAVTSLARSLRADGLARGERVLILAETSLLGIAAYLAVMHAGGVAVPLPSQIAPGACRSIVESTGARFAFLQAKALPELQPALRGMERLIVDERPAVDDATTGPPAGMRLASLPALLSESGPPPHAEPVQPERDLAALLFTSGSTSDPRGVMLSHANILANTRSILAYLALTERDRAMMVLPFYYSFGASLLHTHLCVGASLVVDRRFMFPDKVLRRMQETRCTGFAGVPSHFQVLLRRSQLKRMALPDLRWVQQAGGKLPSHFIQELQEAVPAARIFIMYGATEATARLCALPPEMLGAKLGSVGKAIPGVTVKILNEDGEPAAPGQVGEITAAGDNIALGYWGNPPEAASTFRQGRLHTGNLGFMDEDGYVFIVDRAKDFIKCAGNRTSTKMLEEVLLRFPDIAEAAVLGIPDDTLGEAVAALAVARVSSDPTVAARLLAFAEEQLPAHLVPRQVTIVAALPKNSAGKVLRPQLRALLA